MGDPASQGGPAGEFWQEIGLLYPELSGERPAVARLAQSARRRGYTARAAWVRRVLVGGVGCPVLAYGHNVSDEDVAALRHHGVRVCRGRLRKAALNDWLGRVPAGRE